MASNPRKKKVDNPGGMTHTKSDGTEIPMIAMKVYRWKKPGGMFWVAIDGKDLHMRPIR